MATGDYIGSNTGIFIIYFIDFAGYVMLKQASLHDQDNAYS